MPEQQPEAVRVGSGGGNERVDGSFGEAAGALADGSSESVADPAEDVAVQVVLGVEVPVEDRSADTGLGCDVVEPGADESPTPSR